MKAFPFSESVDFEGEWRSLGQTKPVSIPGRLSWSSKRATLQLHDTFDPQRGDIYGDERYGHEAIHGTTTRGQRVSMLHAMASGNQISIGDAGFRESQKLTSSWVVIGEHVSPDSTYRSVRARIPGLQLWLGPRGVSQTIRRKTSEVTAAVTYFVEAVPEEIVEVPSVPLVLGWGIDRNFSGNLDSEVTIRSSACLRIRSEVDKPLDWFIEQMGKATTLLSFLAGVPMSANELQGELSESGKTVEVLVSLRQDTLCTVDHSNKFFLDRQTMEADLGATFSRWFELYEQVHLPSQLALSILSSEDLWSHVEFLSLMQGLEGFHRSQGGGHYLSEADYVPIKDDLIRAIPATVSQDHRDALKSKIKFGHEFSLRKRLAQVVARLDPVVRETILGKPGAIPSSWVHTRNYYTHWDDASREGALSGIEMHRAGVRMRHLLRVLYLDLVGVPSSAIAKALGNAFAESQYLIQLNNTDRRTRDPDAKITPMMTVEVRDAASPGSDAA